MSRKLPKRIAAPAGGLSVDDEPDDAKAARLLAMFRYMTENNRWTEGLTIGGAQYMVIRYRPQPHGPHMPDADMSGTSL
jgi:hypothetical protein